MTTTKSPIDVLNSVPDQQPDIQADTTDTPNTTVGAQVKSGAPAKGGIAPVGTTALSPEQTSELLANMQEMIAQKTGGWNKFMGHLQDALAYATPIGGGQQAMALQYRNQQKQQEMQDISTMRQQMAALQSSAQQAQAQSDWADKYISGGAGADTGAQATGGAGGFGGLSPAAQARVMSVPKGPQRYAMIQEELKNLSQVQNKRAYDVAGDTPQKYWVEGYGEMSLTPNEYRKLPKQIKDQIEMSTFKKFGYTPSTSTGGLQGAAAGAPQLRPGETAESIARGLGVPLTSGTRSYDKQAKMYEESQKPGYTGPVVAKPTTSSHVSGYGIDVNMEKATPQQLQGLRDAGFRQTVKSEPWHWELPRTDKVSPVQVAGPAQPLPVQKPVAPPASIAPTAGAPMPQQKDYPSQAAWMAAVDDWKEIQKSARAPQEKGASEYAGNLAKTDAAAAAGADDAYLSSGERLARSNRSLNLIDDPGVKKMIGYLEKPGVSAAFLRTLRDGITMGRFGAISLKEIDSNIAKTDATKEEIALFDELANNLRHDEAMEARAMFKGQGQVSDSERKLISNIVGSISNAAESLKVAIKWRQERAQLDQEMGRAFNKYRDDNGEYAPFSRFMRSPEGQQVIAAHNERLAKMLNIPFEKLAGNQAYDRNTRSNDQGEQKTNRRPLGDIFGGAK